MSHSSDPVETLIEIIKVAAIAIIGFILIKALLQAAAS
jgi:hypothetical protein